MNGWLDTLINVRGDWLDQRNVCQLQQNVLGGVFKTKQSSSWGYNSNSYRDRHHQRQSALLRGPLPVFPAQLPDPDFSHQPVRVRHLDRSQHGSPSSDLLHQQLSLQEVHRFGLSRCLLSHNYNDKPGQVSSHSLWNPILHLHEQEGSDIHLCGLLGPQHGFELPNVFQPEQRIWGFLSTYNVRSKEQRNHCCQRISGAEYRIQCGHVHLPGTGRAQELTRVSLQVRPRD